MGQHMFYIIYLDSENCLTIISTSTLSRHLVGRVSSPTNPRGSTFRHICFLHSTCIQIVCDCGLKGPVIVVAMHLCGDCKLARVVAITNNNAFLGPRLLGTHILQLLLFVAVWGPRSTTIINSSASCSSTFVTWWWWWFRSNNTVFLTSWCQDSEWKIEYHYYFVQDYTMLYCCWSNIRANADECNNHRAFGWR